MERLQKVIANKGYTSRRRAEELIVKGKVLVNGVKVTELGVKVSLKDVITVEGKVLINEEKEYILLYKPEGVVTTTSDEHDRKTVMNFINTSLRIYPVGRLDYDTSGIILLTNDGDIANFLTNPKNRVSKTYTAKVKGIMYPDMLKSLRNGVLIEGYKTKKAVVKVDEYNKKSDNSIVSITIFEGKNHQIRKMFEVVGSSVIKLKRESIDFLNLDGLKKGEYRYLSIKEVKKIYGMMTEFNK